MRQKIYTMQEKLVDLEPVIKKYEGDPRFRMAYIFRQLDDWLKSLRGLYFAMSKWSNTAENRFKRRIWSYEHAARNIDVTYTVDYLAHVHATYIKQMEDIMPAAQREEMQKERERMLSCRRRTSKQADHHHAAHSNLTM
ncbi:uncharacterized protein LOC110380152 isoform X1 [Helicoverpa armigera]|uniref:uncharacterized protein LOC110380152 isoform X1 n=1 Tax=Helicoverpa armigera TaxID=29058 RepID=UPI003082EA3A